MRPYTFLVHTPGILIDCIIAVERRRRARAEAGQPPVEWRVSMSGRVAKGLRSFEDALTIARAWTANTSWRIYSRDQPYAPPSVYEPT